MELSIKDKVYKLLDEVSCNSAVKAIGQTGDIKIEPRPGESDIDIFVLCDSVPDFDSRKSAYDRNSMLFDDCRMNVCEGGVWGTGDIFSIDGVETMLMHFSIDETLSYVDEILSGRYPDKIDGFYPVGRCSTLLNINVIYDAEGILDSLKKRLKNYPSDLKDIMVEFHIGKINDREDFGRAVRRRDALFYHLVLENALDHYLQALFAINETFFPSRKRTKQYMDQFGIKPQNCYDRLLNVIKLGSDPEGIEESYLEWSALTADLSFIRDNTTRR